MRIFTNTDIDPKLANHLVRPFCAHDDSFAMFKEKFPTYVKQAPSLLQITSPKDCDVALYPFWRTTQRKDPKVAKFLADAQQHGKKAVLLTIDDYPTHVGRSKKSQTPPGAIVFKPSLFANNRHAREHAMPAVRRDTQTEAHNYKLDTTTRPKSAVPTIGFCGQVHSCQIRTKAIKYIADSKLKTNFILRGSFWGCLSREEIKSRSKKYHIVRKAFINNILTSDYALCIRGMGNWSIRFYEALACGRIPLLIDTDCVLPFGNQIKWRDHILKIDKKDINNIGRIVTKFHNSMSDAQFAQRQRKCRKLWKDWLSLVGFAKNFRQIVMP